MIELRHLRKEFEDITPLEDVNVTINSGDVISVIGPSGTGKSTLLRCINMLEPPTSGEIIVDGQVINDGKCDLNEIRKKMGMVFQSFNLFGHLTVIENIMNPQITLLGRSRQEAYDKAMYLLNTVGLSSKAFNYPEDLSGGQQQRIAIARTLAMDPDIILFDEPTSALDISVQAQILNLLLDLQEKMGLTYLVITHDLNVIKYISDKIAVMYLGRLVEFGPTEEIANNARHPYTRGLLDAAPVLDPRLRDREKELLGGDPGSLIKIGPGCRFCDRCKYVTDECKSTMPENRMVTSDHMVACFHPLDME